MGSNITKANNSQANIHVNNSNLNRVDKKKQNQSAPALLAHQEAAPPVHSLPNYQAALDSPLTTNIPKNAAKPPPVITKPSDGNDVTNPVMHTKVENNDLNNTTHKLTHIYASSNSISISPDLSASQPSLNSFTPSLPVKQKTSPAVDPAILAQLSSSRGSLANRRSSNKSISPDYKKCQNLTLSDNSLKIPTLQPPKLETQRVKTISSTSPSSPRTQAGKEFQSKYQGLDIGVLPVWLRLVVQPHNMANGNVFKKMYTEIEKADLKRRSSKTYSTLVSSSHDNSKKNRYQDIIPYDKNRVQIPTCPYINASHILAFSQKFIATQGPLPNTTGDFWEMVWECNSGIIVMLTKEEENGRIKCHRYWPDVRGSTKTIIPNTTLWTLQVRLDSHEVLRNGSIILQIFTLTNIPTTSSYTAKRKRVWHIQFLAWPDHAASDVSLVLILHDFVRYLTQRAAWEYAGIKNSGNFKEICHEKGFDPGISFDNAIQKLYGGIKKEEETLISHITENRYPETKNKSPIPHGDLAPLTIRTNTFTHGRSTSFPIKTPTIQYRDSVRSHSLTSVGDSICITSDPTTTESDGNLSRGTVSKRKLSFIAKTKSALGLGKKTKSCLANLNFNWIGPSIFHCSAGCGRTGTLLAIFIVLSIIESPDIELPPLPNVCVGKTEDLVFYVVDLLRDQRVSSVQTISQFVLIYEAVVMRMLGKG